MSKALYEAADSVPADAYALYMDTSLLLFHHSYFALVPHMKRRGLGESLARLRHAYRQFTLVAPSAADHFNLLGLCLELEGKPVPAATAFADAARATTSDDAVYLTRIQAACSRLLELRRFHDAMAFLLAEHRRVTSQDMPEFDGLVLWVLDIAQRQSTARRPRHA